MHRKKKKRFDNDSEILAHYKQHRGNVKIANIEQLAHEYADTNIIE